MNSNPGLNDDDSVQFYMLTQDANFISRLAFS